MDESIIRILKRKKKLALTPRKEHLTPCGNFGYLKAARVCGFRRLKMKVENYMFSRNGVV